MPPAFYLSRFGIIMTATINRSLLTLYLLVSLSGATMITIEIETDTTLSDLVAQGIDVRHRTPRGRQASFETNGVEFKCPDGFEIQFEKGECIIEFLPNQRIWYLDYYERTFTDRAILESRMATLVEQSREIRDHEVAFQESVGLSIRGGLIHERIIKFHARPSDKTEGWLHLFMAPQKLSDRDGVKYSLLDAEILPPFEYPDHDMTPIGNFPGSKSEKKRSVSEGWRSPAQPGARKRIRDKKDEDVVEISEKNSVWWIILSVVILGIVWLILKVFYKNAKSGR